MKGGWMEDGEKYEIKKLKNIQQLLYKKIKFFQANKLSTRSYIYIIYQVFI